MEIDLVNSMELLAPKEWQAFLTTRRFANMQLTPKMFGDSCDLEINTFRPLLRDMIREHNNKVKTLTMTYSICMHYFDKGIPDDPWYSSPGDAGQPAKYMPLFSEEHWARHYWFSYYSNIYYLQIASIWDSIYEIINYYYGLRSPSNWKLKRKVRMWLKANKPKIAGVINKAMKSSLHKKAHTYRIAAAHGVPVGTVKNTVTEQKGGSFISVSVRGNDGKITTKRVKTKRVISVGAGDYVNVATIQKNMGDYACCVGDAIKEIVLEIAK